MPRLLLLLPTTTYRTQAFLDAAAKLGVEVTVGSDHAQSLADQQPIANLTLNFRDPDGAARAAVEFASNVPIDAVVGVDDDSTLLAAVIAEALSLPHNPVSSVAAAKNKHLMREMLSGAGVPIPRCALFSVDDDPYHIARKVTYPCVVKPLILAASRGVIRADNEDELVAAFRRVVKILGMPDVAMRGTLSLKVLVEGFVPGQEVALEGLLRKGELELLALFDKPDPLDGPFFEETIYVTPSRLPQAVQEEIVLCAERAARALGISEGPIHAELRWNENGPWVIEIAARTIGGLCSRALHFASGMSLEELVLRHALGMEIPSLERERRAAGVMMIPIPHAGVLSEVRGQSEAKSVSGIEEIVITAHITQELVPLPEGAAYLGFIFARADTPSEVETALREAHRRLEFVITPFQEKPIR